MMKRYFSYVFFLTSAALTLIACQDQDQPAGAENPSKPEDRMQIVRLGSQDTSGLESIRTAFAANNPGYDLHYYPRTRQLEAREAPRLAFLQQGGGTATVNEEYSKISVGDIINIPAGATLTTDSLVDLLVFSTPEPIPADIPVFVRPDWDPNITDTPGGCATETNAYRRILLTWEGKNGPYLYHALNAHRVRIMNSFTHYHPLQGGFDEFYLVQMAQPKARIITSEKVDLITEPESVSKDDVAGLLQDTPLDVGDLVYLPRGVAHRGIDGVLAQVITVPGFIPGSEIGIDHHLKAINEQLGLVGEAALPYHEEAAQTVMVK